MKKFISITMAVFLFAGVFAGCASSTPPAPTPAPSAAVPADAVAASSDPAPTDAAVPQPDVIIVGGGLAGIVTAISAADEGAKALILEKTGALGGNARYAAGFISGAETKIQANLKIEDSNEKFYANIVRLARDEKNLKKDIATYYAYNSGKAVDWLLDRGVNFLPDPHFGVYDPLDVKRVYTVDGKGNALVTKLTEILDTYVADGKVTVMLDTLVTEMTMDNGVCVGVKTQDGKEIKAKSTVLTAGGYSANREMFNNVYTNVKTGSPDNCVGTAYELAKQVGAKQYGFDYSFSYGGAINVDEQFRTTRNANVRYPGVIWVDKNGKRIVDEYAVDAKLRADAWLESKDNIVYLILNQADLKDDAPIITGDEKNTFFKEQVAKDALIYQADTIAALADKIGVDAKALEETIARYNGFVKKGADADFGRTANLVELKGPFYAIETMPYVITSFGGIVMDDQTRVLNENDQPIAGLFAAGEAASFANIAGYNTCAGSFLGHAVTFGLQAGKVAAKNALS